MNPQILFLFVLLLNLISISFQNPNPKSTPSLAHVELTNYGFPVGLLPATTVLGYTVNHTTGEFNVRLGGACKITLPPDNYVATYSKTIKGKIVKGHMAELDGISVRAFFKWWSITGIRSSGDNIVFEVGMVTAKYPSKNFDESPACEGKHSSS
ncbi:hypothetical protein TanjilG_04538 [Lupinus angustifolius]|uniref:DUF538 family protein n=1 Tax=Lupinus angustifolius TaxID=3871 RepID=A0A4P1RQS0_LUPAN|nr:PREDICTED: uncharacterized protein LOC109343010 [Lupinus angustifolius]XP_019436657.1 PREDICTED: uncharacterized protein LOC109343010 [Lupinus angustifolius]XP_019436658.1 PREDICTED: uncharacterized protein LOC109343010 [Lupinus angustifolius]XP_019436659.1 PREDICTED: uncharacterized protein LOC109343010 [Lupinus angustifolius]XP_019436660.1 PREDICTED: uncharacterized protein LOC109343010 [Lupinus angustifolius]XP_019436661.1 PREDICTED: uncharacterized protein LOC109343010 [Lupinus angustif